MNSLLPSVCFGLTSARNSLVEAMSALTEQPPTMELEDGWEAGITSHQHPSKCRVKFPQETLVSSEIKRIRSG